MSKESMRNRSVNTEIQNEEKEERFEIRNSNKVEFNGLNKSTFMKSSKICSLANEIFSNIYEDFEGSTFEISPNGDMYICLWFNHNVVVDEDSIVAFSQYEDNIDINNELVRKRKSNERRSRLGNKYFITKCGKEGLEKFMKRSIENTSLRNGKNKVLWDRCYTDMAETQYHYNAQQAPKVYTKLSYIDIASLLKFKHGSSIVTGVDATTGKKIRSSVKFDVKLHQALVSQTVNGFYTNKEYLLKIDQINEDELKAILQEMGVGAYTSFGIVK